MNRRHGFTFCIYQLTDNCSIFPSPSRTSAWVLVMASWQECTCLQLLWKPVKDGLWFCCQKEAAGTHDLVSRLSAPRLVSSAQSRMGHVVSFDVLSFRLRSCLFTPDSTLKASRMAFLFDFNLSQCPFISTVGALAAGFMLPSIYICLRSLAYKQRYVPQGFLNSLKEELYLSPSHLSLCVGTE